MITAITTKGREHWAIVQQDNDDINGPRKCEATSASCDEATPRAGTPAVWSGRKEPRKLPRNHKDKTEPNWELKLF